MPDLHLGVRNQHMKVASQLITSPIVCQPNTEYDLTGSTLERKSAGYCMEIRDGVNGVKIFGGELIGGGIKAIRTDGTTIDGVTVRNTFPGSDGGHNNAFNIDTFTNSKLLNTKSYNVGGFSAGGMGGTAIWLWKSLHKSTFRKNLVEGALEAFHSFHRGGVTSEDVLFEYNEARKCTRHAYEMQNYSIMRGWTLRGNLAHDFVTRDSWPGHMGFSLACGQSKGTQGVETDKGPPPYINDDFIVEGNVVLATGDILEMFKSGKANYRNSCAFELMGNFIFRSNYVDGFPHVTLSEYTRPNLHTYENNVYLTWPGGPKCYGDTYVGYEGPPIMPNNGGGEGETGNNYFGKSGDKPIPPAGISGGGTVPPIPPTEPTKMKVTSATAFTSFVRVVIEGTATGKANIQWRGGDGVWTSAPNVIGAAGSYDVAFDKAKYASWWLWFRMSDGAGTSAEVKANEQLGKTADPGTPPPNPTPGNYILVNETEINGVTGAVVRTKATTKPVQ